MTVLIADKMDHSGLEALKELGFEVVFKPELKGPELQEAVKATRCKILVVRSTKVPRETLEAGGDLKLVVRAGSGYDTIDVTCANERNVRVCNCPGMNSVAVAEIVMGMMVALDRCIVDSAVNLQKGVWNKKKYSVVGQGLKGRKLGLIGFGSIGHEVAHRAAAFEMALSYCDIVEQPEWGLDIQKIPFDVLLKESDFVSVHVPGGDKTRHLIGERELALMKPSAFLLNYSRGGIVDQAALAKALKAGKLRGAALDVYENEPGAAEKEFKDPIVECPGVYGTHHVGASTMQAQEAVAEEAVRIIRAFRDKGEFLNCVNPQSA